MSTKEKNAHEEAYNKALEEISKEKIAEIKAVAKTILQQMQKYKEQKEEAEEAMRLLKLDLDDLREGKIEKIRERHEKSKKAGVYNPITIPANWTSINGTTTTAGNGGVYGSNGSHYVTNTSGSASSAGGNWGGGIAIEDGVVYLESQPPQSASVTNLFAQAQDLHNKLWNDMTSGTYLINTKNGGVKEFWL